MKKVYLLLLAVFSFATTEIFGEANYVYHEATTNFVNGISGTP